MVNVESGVVKYEVALTTTDNPYDYFTQNDEWFAYEQLTGSRCLYNLGLFCHDSPFLSHAEYMNEVERAIDEIIEYDVTNTFKKLKREL